MTGKVFSAIGEEVLVAGMIAGIAVEGPPITIHEIIQIMIAETSITRSFMRNPWSKDGGTILRDRRATASTWQRAEGMKGVRDPASLLLHT